MSVQSAMSPTSQTALPVSPEEDAGKVSPDQIYAPNMTPHDKKMQEIGNKIIQAGEKLKKFHCDSDRLLGIDELWRVAGQMIRQGYSYPAIEARIDNVIAALTTKLEIKYKEQRKEDVRKIACFGQRLSCTDFSQRPSDITPGSAETIGIAAGGLIRGLHGRVAERTVAAEMEQPGC